MVSGTKPNPAKLCYISTCREAVGKVEPIYMFFWVHLATDNMHTRQIARELLGLLEDAEFERMVQDPVSIDSGPVKVNFVVSPRYSTRR